MKKIVYGQLDITLKNWGSAIAKYYPDELIYWNNPDKHIEAHQKKWNYIAAVDFCKNYVKGRQGLKCLDLGCGTGWLAAGLSSMNEIDSIDAIDSDEKMLQNMLPAITERLGGNGAKINPVHGLFTPLLTTPAGGYDFIFMSSAAHHHDNIYDLVQELEKSLAPGGYIFLLNEVPIPDWTYRYRLFRLSTRIFLNSFKPRAMEKGFGIFMNGTLYDPILGDISYSERQWKNILASAPGMNWERIDSGLPPYKAKDGFHLVHFVGKKK